LTRIRKDQFEYFKELSDWVGRYPRKSSTLLVGIDGFGGTGKLAEQLSNSYAKCEIVHMDDFYLPAQQLNQNIHQNKYIGADFNWKRIRDQVLVPLSNNKEGYYQRYDWETGQLEEWHVLAVGGIVLFEGVYTTRSELETFYDAKIWVDCPRDTKLCRGLERDREETRERRENDWMISEDIYMREHRPKQRSDIILSGTQLLKLIR
jgi:uridine kinase